MPPRWSPATTVPSSSKGRPSRAADRRSPPLTASRIALDEHPDDRLDWEHLEAEAHEQVARAGPPLPEAKVRADSDGLGADRAEIGLGELLRGKSLQLGCERATSVAAMPAAASSSRRR